MFFSEKAGREIGKENNLGSSFLVVHHRSIPPKNDFRFKAELEHSNCSFRYVPVSSSPFQLFYCAARALRNDLTSINFKTLPQYFEPADAKNVILVIKWS